MRCRYPDTCWKVRGDSLGVGHSDEHAFIAALSTPHGMARIDVIEGHGNEPRLCGIRFIFNGREYCRWPIVKSRRGAVIAAGKFVREIVAKHGGKAK